MTAPSTDDLIALLAEATPGPWSGFNMVHSDTGEQMTPEELGEYVCNSAKIGDQTRFLFVSGKHDDGGDADICHTGNGPRGPANTALIAAAPAIAADLIACRAERDAQREALMTVRDYAFDASTGALTYRGRGDLSEMATEDLSRIDAALASREAPPAVTVED